MKAAKRAATDSNDTSSVTNKISTTNPRRSSRRKRQCRVDTRIPDTRTFDDVRHSAARVALEDIKISGFSDVTSSMLPKNTVAIEIELDRWLKISNKPRNLHTGRKAINIPVKRATAILERILSPAVVSILDAYIYGGWKLVGMQTIKVQPRSAVQKFHRDHQHGLGFSLVVSLSVDDCPLRTLMLPGSHTDHDTMSSSLFSADALAVQFDRQKRSVAIKGRMMIYDPHIIHAGGANPDNRWWSRRLFVTFASNELSNGDLRDMQQTNSLEGYRNYEKHQIFKLFAKRKKAKPNDEGDTNEQSLRSTDRSTSPPSNQATQ